MKVEAIEWGREGCEFPAPPANRERSRTTSSRLPPPVPASWFPAPSRPRAGASAQLTPSALVASTTPGGTRTHDLRFRKPPLYPAELRAQMLIPQRLLRSLAAGHAARNALHPTPCQIGALVRAPGGRRLATRPIILALARRHVKAGPRARASAGRIRRRRSSPRPGGRSTACGPAASGPSRTSARRSSRRARAGERRMRRGCALHGEAPCRTLHGSHLSRGLAGRARGLFKDDVGLSSPAGGRRLHPGETKAIDLGRHDSRSESWRESTGGFPSWRVS